MTSVKAAAKRALRLGARGLPSGRVILLYHRVAAVDCDPWGLCVSPSNFAEHLDVLSRWGPCMRLSDMVQALNDGTLPRRAIAVTFDDGYADNLHHASPLLEARDVPATFFLITGLLDHEREFWWDELEGILLQPGSVPSTLALTIAGCQFHWELTTKTYSLEEFRRYQKWEPSEAPPTGRQALYLELWHLLRPLAANAREAVLDELASWAGRDRAARPSHRALTGAEAAALGRDGLFEIGAHTVTHPALPSLLPPSQRREIGQSRAESENLCGRPVTALSYPFGLSSPGTAALVREAGFKCACSTEADVIRPSADHFHLPRVQVLNWDGEELARRLARDFV